MAASIRDFHSGLYLEHLEEASFLYEQRLAYLHDPELTWLDLEDFEERFEAHVDALVVGADLALEVCADRAREGDFGELHAAMRVFCRQASRERGYTVLRDIDTADRAATRAAADALQADCPAAWLDELPRILARHPRLAPVLACALGARRVKSAVPALVEVLGTAAGQDAACMLWALGRTGDGASAVAVEKHVGSDDPEVSAAAACAAIRLGQYQPVRYALLAAQARPWLSATLALGGDRAGVNVLVERASKDRVTDDVLIGLGLLGDLTAVRAVFDCLAIPERAPAAATALQLITGAELYEEVFAPEEVDPDELFDEERERYEATGEPPKRADGQPFGSMMVQPVTDQSAWKDWLSANKSRFDRERRYRYGEPYSPRALLRTLLAERVPNRIRALVCDELLVRFGLDFPMEIDMPVIEQKRRLARLAEWVQVNESRFEPGEWYFHGRRLSAEAAR